jgi:MftR C-terminal domain
MRAAVRRAASNPGLTGVLDRAMLVTEAPLAEPIADRTGTDPGRDLYPSLAAAAAVSALRTTIGFWLNARGTPPNLRDLLRWAIAETVPPPPARPNVKETRDGT